MSRRLEDLYRGVAVHATADLEHQAALGASAKRAWFLVEWARSKQLNDMARVQAYELLAKREQELEQKRQREAEELERLEREEAARRQDEKTQHSPSGGRGRQSVGEALAKSVARTIGSTLGRQIIRGILGSIIGRR